MLFNRIKSPHRWTSAAEQKGEVAMDSLLDEESPDLGERVGTLGLRATGVVLSTVGLSAWFVLGAAGEFAVIQDLRMQNLLVPAEEMTLKVAIGLAFIVVVLLLGSKLESLSRFRGPVLVFAALVSVALLFVEIGGVCLAPQFEMKPGSFQALVATLAAHVLATVAIFGHYVAYQINASYSDEG